MTSFAGPCFSAGSALGRRLDGDQKNEAGNNLGRVLIAVMRPVLQPSRTHLIHRHAKDALSHRLVESYGVILVTLALRSWRGGCPRAPRRRALGEGMAGADTTSPQPTSPVIVSILTTRRSRAGSIDWLVTDRVSSIPIRTGTENKVILLMRILISERAEGADFRRRGRTSSKSR